MRRTGSTAGVILLVLGCLLAAAPARSAREEAAPTTAEWLEDVRYFARELPKRHKNLHHTMPREQFEQAVKELEASVPTLSQHQIVVRLAQIAARVGDGHTRVHLPESFRRYPIGLFWFGNELRVIAATREYERALGARVVRIGHLGIDEAQERVAGCFPSAENENQWYVLSSSPAFIVRAEVLHALGIVPDPERAAFTFEDDQGERFTLELIPVIPDGTLLERFLRAAASEPLARQRRGERFWFTYLPDSRTVYVSFRGYESLGEKARELHRFIDSNTTDRVVIDMRQNGGGDFFQGRKHIVEPLKQRPGINQRGRLFVVIGRQTFSAAMVNAIDFRKETNALLVGEPAGERPNSYSENDEMKLPHSRIVVSYSTRYYKFLDEDAPAVLPDQRIDPSWPEYKAGRDPVMDWILAHPPAELPLER